VAPLNWNKDQVADWLKKANINKEIKYNVMGRDLDACDGKVLFEMFKMLNAAPDFFYESISSSRPGLYNCYDHPLTVDLARFSMELKKLFES
jgi:hypothetical protein